MFGDVVLPELWSMMLSPRWSPDGHEFVGLEGSSIVSHAISGGYLRAAAERLAFVFQREEAE